MGVRHNLCFCVIYHKLKGIVLFSHTVHHSLHRIIEWLDWKRPYRSSTSTPCHGQGHFPLDQVVQTISICSYCCKVQEQEQGNCNDSITNSHNSHTIQLVKFTLHLRKTCKYTLQMRKLQTCLLTT